MVAMVGEGVKCCRCLSRACVPARVSKGTRLAAGDCPIRAQGTSFQNETVENEIPSQRKAKRKKPKMEINQPVMCEYEMSSEREDLV